VRIQEENIELNDVLAFEFPIEFEEQIVESLQVEGQDVDIVPISQLAGIKTHLTKDQLVKGTRVFKVLK